jgi:hypothetical protein
VVAELGGATRIVTSAHFRRRLDRLALPIALRLGPIDLPRGLGLLNYRGDFDRHGFRAARAKGVLSGLPLR